jgi:Sec-independent protein secretion pathway component TatC
MNAPLAILGGIGIFGFIGSGFVLVACWANYVVRVSVQRTFKPNMGKHDKELAKYSVFSFLFFTIYVALYIACREVWHF